MGSPLRRKKNCAVSAQRSKDPQEVKTLKEEREILKKRGKPLAMVLRQGGEPTSQVIYAFIETEKSNHRISRMCKALKVSKSGFYGWRDRAPSAKAGGVSAEQPSRVR